VLLSNNGRITVADLPPEIARPTNVPSIGFATLQSPAADTARPASSPTSLREVERQQILAALEQTGWHRGKTAEILGISPSTLYRRLRDYNLEKRH
jgi:transcriptional regulator of acetoin/glycerol metabolism